MIATTRITFFRPNGLENSSKTHLNGLTQVGPAQVLREQQHNSKTKQRHMKTATSVKANIQKQLDKKLRDLTHAVDSVSGDIAQKLHLTPPHNPPIQIPEGDVVDVYGMPLDKSYYESYHKADQKFEKNLEKQRKVLGPLSAHLSNNNPDVSVFAPHVKNGIPEEFRPVLWPLFMEKHTALRRTPGKYDDLLTTDYNKIAVAVQQISKDLHRTFSSYGGEEFRTKLKRVLQCYAAYNPDVGYCQAMNFLAGGLLVFCSEEISFWMLTYIVDQMLAEYYSESMAGSIADCAVLEELLTSKYPALMQHLAKVGMPLQLIVTQWFMCLFVNTLPPIAAFQIWDLIFYFGPKIIFEVSIAIFKITQKEIMLLDDPVDIVYFLNKFNLHLYDVSKILDEIQPLDASEIDQLRTKHRVRINGEAKKKDTMKLAKYVETHAKFGSKEMEDLQQCFRASGAVDEIGVDLDTFLKSLQQVLPQLMDTSDQNLYFDEDVPVSHRLFGLFDVNGDNLVNFRDLACGLSVMCKVTLDDRLRRMGRQELSALLSSLYSMYFDKGFQKEISFFTDMIFMEADKNSDGFLAFAEFQEAAELQPFLMKCFRVDSATTTRI